MGLSAGVYKNLRGVSDVFREKVRLVDAETGEIEEKEDGLSGPDPGDLFAIKVRIGNISAVAEFRYEVENRLPGKSVLMDAILYNGSHSGDFLPFGQLGELDRELKLIEGGPQPLSPYLQEFLVKMNSLVDAARREKNPIVFV